MNPGEIFVPIMFFLVIGAIFITYFYLKSREKQMLIERGISTEEIKEFLMSKKDRNPYIMSKIGVISIAFGLGLGLAIMFESYTHEDYWVPMFIFVFTGAGFIIANFIGRKKENE